MSQTIVKYGLIAALVYILRTVITYIIGISSGFFLNSVIGILFFAAVIYLGYLAVKEIRAMNDDRITVGNAFGTAISVFFITIVISVLFSYLMFNVIDPDYPERVKIETIQMMDQRFDKMGFEGDQRDEAIEKIENKDFSYSATNVLKTTGFSLLIFGAVAFIIAMAVKKDLNDQPAEI